ncbi:MAG: hypothetical protein IT555_10740 [Acetobacteraceae bacterium]|nr:hypothetical protein [Acetobacteraceae bacterium]
MSTIATGFSLPATSGSGARGSVIGNATQVRDRLDQLTRQASSGLVADTYGGLGSGAATSLSLRPAITRIAAWQANIDAVQGRMAVTQSSLAQISGIAADFRARTADLNGLSATMIDSVAASARDALRSVAGLLNARQGDQYVFAGQDSANPPIPQADAILNSGFYTAIAGAIGGLSGNGAAATIAASRAIATSNAPGVSPFSTALSQPPAALDALAVRVPVDDGRTEPVGILASANAEATSTGATTTGSYMRDILRGLATLGALDSTQMNDPGFADVVADARDTLAGAVSALNVDAGVLGNRQAAIAEAHTRMGDTATVLQGQVSDVEDVDMAAVLSRLSLTQTQLQASYQLLAGLQALSLTKFLQG